MLQALVGSTWDTLGEGTWRNSVITWSTVVLVVSFTWLLVAFTGFNTVPGTPTPWKRLGRTALFVWGALAASITITYVGVPIISGLTGLFQLALIGRDRVKCPTPLKLSDEGTKFAGIPCSTN